METRSFVVIASNKSNVESQIEKLNKRARKLGIEEISFAWGKAYVETREVLYKDNEEPTYLKQDLLVIPIDISGPMDVSFEGWRFIATLQHLPTGENIIRSISDKFHIPKQYRNAGPDCHHCMIKRYRKDTYLVRNDTTGEVIQVGSTCIKDFLGGNSPDNIISKANIIAELLTFMEGCGSCNGSSEDNLYHIERFLSVTSACIRDHGWLSKSKAYTNGGISTAVWVERNLLPPKGFKNTDFSIVNDYDKDVAKKAAEWAENISDSECDISDYLHNIRAIARSGMVGYRCFGFAASIIPAYHRAHEVKTPASVHIGEVGKRENFTLTLQKRFSFDSQYGITNKFIFIDDKGNIVTWTTTKSIHSQTIQEGKVYSIQGTVKKHTEYKGTKQTEITRCKVLT